MEKSPNVNLVLWLTLFGDFSKMEIVQKKGDELPTAGLGSINLGEMPTAGVGGIHSVLDRRVRIARNGDCPKSGEEWHTPGRGRILMKGRRTRPCKTAVCHSSPFFDNLHFDHFVKYFNLNEVDALDEMVENGDWLKGDG